MLKLSGVETCYGCAQVLFGVDLEMRSGEMVALMGRNGMGKTTIIRSIMGLEDITAGKIFFKGKQINGSPSFSIARMGMGLVPEGRQIFSSLRVKENLVATARGNKDIGAWTLDRVYDLFPILKERQGNMGSQLSGGEQQMLAMGRSLMTNPDLLILDEATEGLAPLIRDRIWDCLETIRESGLSILVVDKNIKRVSSVCDRVYILEKGRMVWQGNPGTMYMDVVKSSLGI